MLKIIGVIFTTLICSILFKNKQPFFSMIISIAGAIIVFVFVCNQIEDIKNKLLDYTNQISTLSQYIILMLKVLVIVLITQFMSDICHDNGNIALANITEISAKIVVISMCFPLFENILNIVLGLVK